ncbi:MAG: replication protein RepA, partial [Acidobacteriaceae bacterium]|nr:replication protein RepA [Acidobacteriaceae bacterium]
PYGAKSRLVLMYINQRAILAQSSKIEVEASLTSFVQHVLGLAPHGRNLKLVKEQLLRLARAEISFSRIAMLAGGSSRVTTRDVKIISGYSLWASDNPNERTQWPSVVELSQEYFQSLMNHAVPLNESHIAALSHNAMALDIYAWLAQRLHRVPVERPRFVSWAALHSQFGATYVGKTALRNFRADFRTALHQVLALYKDARIEDEEAPKARLVAVSGSKAWRSGSPKGLTLYNSPSPVPPKVLIQLPS